MKKQRLSRSCKGEIYAAGVPYASYWKFVPEAESLYATNFYTLPQDNPSDLYYLFLLQRGTTWCMWCFAFFLGFSLLSGTAMSCLLTVGWLRLDRAIIRCSCRAYACTRSSVKMFFILSASISFAMNSMRTALRGLSVSIQAMRSVKYIWCTSWISGMTFSTSSRRMFMAAKHPEGALLSIAVT